MAKKYDITDRHADFSSQDLPYYDKVTDFTGIVKATDFKNVFDIYRLVFGYRAVPYPLGDLTGIVPSADSLKGKFSKLGSALMKSNRNGIMCMFPIVIESTDLVDYPGGIMLPNATISITGKKNMIETPLINRAGSVIELISIDSYKIEIKGIAIENDQENGLPQESLKMLSTLWKLNKSVKLVDAVVKDYFLDADNSVVITDIKLPDMKGISGAQAYEISMISDTVLTLEVDDQRV